MIGKKKRRLLAIGLLILPFSALTVAQERVNSGTPPLNSIILAAEKMQSEIRPQPPYQVIREYRLFGAHSSSADSDVIAVLNVKPPSSKEYHIQKTLGSNRGQQIVRRVLDQEIEVAVNHKQAQIALTRGNYDFRFLGTAVLEGNSCYLLELKPKRTESSLISGKAWVDANTFAVRQIQGELAKSPSWWLRKVYVTLGFSEVLGNWLQTSMEAVADVRIVGPHTLTSRILDYRMADEVASTKVDPTHDSSNEKP